MSGGSSDPSATSTLATTDVPPSLLYPVHRGCNTGTVYVGVQAWAKGMQHADDIVDKDNFDTKNVEFMCRVDLNNPHDQNAIGAYTAGRILSEDGGPGLEMEEGFRVAYVDKHTALHLKHCFSDAQINNAICFGTTQACEQDHYFFKLSLLIPTNDNFWSMQDQISTLLHANNRLSQQLEQARQALDAATAAAE